MVSFMENLHHPLFSGLSKEELSNLYSCFHMTVRRYQKGEYLLMESEPVTRIGVPLKGTIHMEKEDSSGNRYLIMELGTQALFADLFMGPERFRETSVNYRAETDCLVLFFDYHLIWKPCSRRCPCHIRFLENMAGLQAAKNRALLSKIEILSHASVRERILTFLCQLKQNQAGELILLPMNHTEMANYLCVNRSSLERELAAMKREGILSWDKHHFTLFIS